MPPKGSCSLADKDEQAILKSLQDIIESIEELQNNLLLAGDNKQGLEFITRMSNIKDSEIRDAVVGTYSAIMTELQLLKVNHVKSMVIVACGLRKIVEANIRIMEMSNSDDIDTEEPAKSTVDVILAILNKDVIKTILFFTSGCVIFCLYFILPDARSVIDHLIKLILKGS